MEAKQIKINKTGSRFRWVVIQPNWEGGEEIASGEQESFVLAMHVALAWISTNHNEQAYGVTEAELTLHSGVGVAFPS